MSASCVSMSAEALPVTMFAFGAAELSGVQPIRPPPPEPTDSGLPPDSPSTQDATPAAAAFEYPLSTRNWPIASRLLPLAMSDCTVELALDEDVVLVPPLEGAAMEVDDGCDVDDADPDDRHVDDADEDDAEVDGAGALEAW